MLHPLIWPQFEKRTCSLSRTSRHLAVVAASVARKNKLSLQRHSSVPVLSFDTEVEELNIATRADTMMTALSPPSSYSITNGRVWYQRLFPILKSPRSWRQLQKKRKNNPPFPRKWRLTLSQYTKEYYFTRIPVKFYACANYWYQTLISLPARTARVKGPGYEAMHISWVPD